MLSETTKLPSPRFNNRLNRCKSNYDFKTSIGSEKKKGNNVNIFSNGNPESHCDEFIKKDIKDVLDLSNCNLNDERVFNCLK